MKILFINLPYYGHVVPTIGLVMELIKRGNQVAYLMPFDWENIISNSGAVFVGYKNHTKLSEQIKTAYAAAEKIIVDYDLVIYEQFFFLGKHLAEKYHKPVVRIFTAPATNQQLIQEYLSADGPLSIFRHKWIGRLWTKTIAKGIPLKTDCWLDEIVENSPELNLVYTLEEYQPYIEDFPQEQYKFLGASIYERAEAEFTIPRTEYPVIYISLGTIIKGASDFFKKCIEAFENQKVTIIMSVGKDFDISRLGTLPQNIHVYPRVPQIAVLKKTDLFITHGGMNSVSEAIVHGVPMVVLPFFADQPTNARRIEELGLGRHLSYNKLNSNTLRTTVLETLSNREIRNNVIKMQEIMQKGPGNQGGADAIIEIMRRKLS